MLNDNPIPGPWQSTKESPDRTPGDHDAIARRAYSIYEQRGREDGRYLDDWLQAERESRQSDRADER